MKHRIVLGAIVALAVAAGLAFLFWPRPMAEPPPLPNADRHLSDEPVVENPLPIGSDATPDAPPLPALADSDDYTISAIGGLVGEDVAKQSLLTPNVLRRLVVTADALPRERVPLLTRPVAAPGDPFAVERQGETITLAEANFARYTPWVDRFAALDARAATDLYIRLYPLLQQAYVEVGDPKKYFNDRYIQVIDHLLATPEVEGPIELEQPSVYYRYKDPALESLSSGQKLLLRMGPANAARVKLKLIEMRALLSPASAGAIR